MEESEISQFTALMKEMSKEIDSNQLSDSKIETFYAFCSKGTSFPAEASNSLIDSFL